MAEEKKSYLDKIKHDRAPDAKKEITSKKEVNQQIKDSLGFISHVFAVSVKVMDKYFTDRESSNLSKGSKIYIANRNYLSSTAAKLYEMSVDNDFEKTDVETLCRQVIRYKGRSNYTGNDIISSATYFSSAVSMLNDRMPENQDTGNQQENTYNSDVVEVNKPTLEAIEKSYKKAFIVIGELFPARITEKFVSSESTDKKIKPQFNALGMSLTKDQNLSGSREIYKFEHVKQQTFELVKVGIQNQRSNTPDRPI